jgi:hypothetical protein
MFDLLRQVMNRYDGFRFLDLPPELRNVIYGMALQDPSLRGQDGFNLRCYLPVEADQVIALKILGDYPPRTANPLLLHVCRQMRSEAGKLYFGSKTFEMYIDDEWCLRDCAEGEVQTWLKTMVGDLAVHLRDVRVHLKSNMRPKQPHHFETNMQVHFRQSHGLQVTGSTEMWDDHGICDFSEPFVDMSAYVAALDKNRVARSQKGQVIVDFFHDWDLLRRACFGPHKKQVATEELDSLGNAVLEWVKCEPDDPDGEHCGFAW